MCSYQPNCIPQPGTDIFGFPSPAVDALSDRLMHRLQSRSARIVRGSHFCARRARGWSIPTDRRRMVDTVVLHYTPTASTLIRSHGQAQ
jgi:hypothetical protein